jgi:uncharacterized protein (DUF1501 family)
VSHDHNDRPLDPTAQRLQCAAHKGCAESHLLMNRRAMLGVTTGLFSWAFMPKFAEAATNDPRLLVVILRGGMDGINVCVPFGDSHYNSMRGDIAIPAAKTLKLNNFFGMHPSMKNFAAMYQRDEAAVVHATCVPLRTRSHFDCQDNLENGMPGAVVADPTGWLNRLLTALPQGSSVARHGAIEIGEAPLILRGPAPVLGWSPTWFEPVRQPTLGAVRALYRSVDAEMHDNLERGLEANRLATAVAGGGGDVSGLRKAFRGAASLIKADDGPRIAMLTVGNFDTHSDQGGATGFLAETLSELDLCIADFKAVMGPRWKNTVMVLATEFGRTVHVNGDHGTDHGVGTVAMLAGGAVNGGKVFGDWPGLAPNQLYEDSDLKPTTDIRSVFKGILRDHIGCGTAMLNNDIFPASATDAPTLRNLIKSSPGGMTMESAAPAAIREETPIARYRRRHSISHAHSA